MASLSEVEILNTSFLILNTSFIFLLLLFKKQQNNYFVAILSIKRDFNYEFFNTQSDRNKNFKIWLLLFKKYNNQDNIY